VLAAVGQEHRCGLNDVQRGIKGEGVTDQTHSFLHRPSLSTNNLSSLCRCDNDLTVKKLPLIRDRSRHALRLLPNLQGPAAGPDDRCSTWGPLVLALVTSLPLKPSSTATLSIILSNTNVGAFQYRRYDLLDSAFPWAGVKLVHAATSILAVAVSQLPTAVDHD
jgi:hypothetical protein